MKFRPILCVTIREGCVAASHQTAIGGETHARRVILLAADELVTTTQAGVPMYSLVRDRAKRLLVILVLHCWLINSLAWYSKCVRAM